MVNIIADCQDDMSDGKGPSGGGGDPETFATIAEGKQKRTKQP